MRNTGSQELTGPQLVAFPLTLPADWQNGPQAAEALGATKVSGGRARTTTMEQAAAEGRGRYGGRAQAAGRPGLHSWPQPRFQQLHHCPKDGPTLQPPSEFTPDGSPLKVA